MRVKSTVPAHKRKNRYFKKAKGRWGARKKLWRGVQETVRRSEQQAYVGRKLRKRDFRSLWIIRIGAQARTLGLSYSHFLHGLKKANIDVNRKVLADLAVQDPAAFAALVEQAKQALA
jgi:large subunit ribosomal protein L20